MLQATEGKTDFGLGRFEGTRVKISPTRTDSPTLEPFLKQTRPLDVQGAQHRTVRVDVRQPVTYIPSSVQNSCWSVLMKKKTRESLLLVDDDRQVRMSTAEWLREQGFDVTEAAGSRQARELIDTQAFSLVLSDIRLGDGDGFEILAHCRKHRPGMLVLLLTGYANFETGVEAIRAGAFDLLTKPLLDDELLRSIRRALSQASVVEETRRLQDQLDSRSGLENIIGQDHRMQRVYEMIDSVADTRATVLIGGESGTGKSMIARAIHRRSSRRSGPFVEIACGALPEALLESELFGHVAGAFTGATGEKMGKFLQADGGTIFLDEIGTAPPSMQVKLLRVLQDLEFEQVGGTKTFRVDTRVILATNEDLARCVLEGRFRQDLFYRINVINIELPPLRERTTDIPLLAQHFLTNVCADAGRPLKRLSEEALGLLMRYPWPGNIRELQNVVERAIFLGKGDVIQAADLPTQLQMTNSLQPQGCASASRLKEALDAPERQIILDTLRANNWNRSATAEALGINRTTLYKKMKKLGVLDPRQATEMPYPFNMRRTSPMVPHWQ